MNLIKGGRVENSSSFDISSKKVFNSCCLFAKNFSSSPPKNFFGGNFGNVALFVDFFINSLKFLKSEYLSVNVKCIPLFSTFIIYSI